MPIIFDFLLQILNLAADIELADMLPVGIRFLDYDEEFAQEETLNAEESHCSKHIWRIIHNI
jgi:hypothetical protein